jgi:dTDP-3-amino-3,4,6-trideoxy-alpha-D-glucose transaminase
MPNAVPFVALDRAHAPLRAELTATFERIVDASAFVLGAEVEAFEAEFGAFCGAGHCVGVANGTAALTLAISALGIGPGDEVIVPAHTFIASALGVVHAGATPVLCDVLPGTGLIDAAAAEALVTDRTAAIMAVHLYGQACDMDAVSAVAERHGLAVIEDAAQAHGATWRGHPCGSLGTVACFSFYPSKNLGALGDGGAVCTGDADLAARVRALRNLGQHRKGEHALLGVNERLDALQAALLRVKLPGLAAANAARREHARAYREGLGDGLRILAETPESPCIYHLFPIRAPARDEVAASLAEAGIQTGVHYSPAVPAHAALAGHARKPEPVPEAEAWAAEELSLPMFPELTAGERDRVIAACHAALGVAAGR